MQTFQIPDDVRSNTENVRMVPSLGLYDTAPNFFMLGFIRVEMAYFN